MIILTLMSTTSTRWTSRGRPSPSLSGLRSSRITMSRTLTLTSTSPGATSPPMRTSSSTAGWTQPITLSMSLRNGRHLMVCSDNQSLEQLKFSVERRKLDVFWDWCPGLRGCPVPGPGGVHRDPRGVSARGRGGEHGGHLPLHPGQAARAKVQIGVTWTHLDQEGSPLRFYWKIIHDPINAAGVAVVGVNNIHLKVNILLLVSINLEKRYVIELTIWLWPMSKVGGASNPRQCLSPGWPFQGGNMGLQVFELII